MKTLLYLLAMLMTSVNAYDGVIKDKYGKTTGYWDINESKNWVEMKDKYGKTESYIDYNDDIVTKDKYGNIKNRYQRTD